jgi:hypothetical protein
METDSSVQQLAFKLNSILEVNGHNRLSWHAVVDCEDKIHNAQSQMRVLSQLFGDHQYERVTINALRTSIFNVKFKCAELNLMNFRVNLSTLHCQIKSLILLNCNIRGKIEGHLDLTKLNLLMNDEGDPGSLLDSLNAGSLTHLSIKTPEQGVFNKRLAFQKTFP